VNEFVHANALLRSRSGSERLGQALQALDVFLAIRRRDTGGTAIGRAPRSRGRWLQANSASRPFLEAAGRDDAWVHTSRPKRQPVPIALNSASVAVARPSVLLVQVVRDRFEQIELKDEVARL